MSLIIGLSGHAGVGKDTVAGMLAKRNFAIVGLADVMKRSVAQWFGWSEDRLFGPSENRNAPDPKYGGLSARKALQFLGTEVGRELYKNVWIDYAIHLADRLICEHRHYDRMAGIDEGGRLYSWAGVVIPDCRFVNEFEAVKKTQLGRLVRITRTGAGLKGAAALHPSETEQDSIPDSAFDLVIKNDCSLDELDALVGLMVKEFTQVG